jgi:ABC-type uncharacterized transport system permease subunit
VLVGAFQDNDNAWTLDNVSLLFDHPYSDAYKTSIEISDNRQRQHHWGIEH